MKHPLIILILSLFIGSVYSNKIKIVNDTELLELITGNGNIMALFSKPDCESCDEIETILENLEDDLKEQAGVVVVKAVSSPLVSLHDSATEPALILYRRSYPLKYSGPITAEEILKASVKRRESSVKELTDDNFEEITQAATGSNAGDWFVFFYSDDCESCMPLLMVWEGVGMSTFNVGRMRMENGASTAKRFNINEPPEFLFLSHGKYYRYKEISFCAQVYIDFAKNIQSQTVEGEIVPPLGSRRIDVMNENVPMSWILMLAVLATAGVFCLLVSKFLKLDKNFYSRTESKSLIVE